MSQLVVLNLGKGNCEQGCPTAIAQLWQADSYAPMQFLTSLPPAPELGELYGRWQRLYEALYAYKGWRRSASLSSKESPSLEIEIDDLDSEVTHISEAEFGKNCTYLTQD